MANTGWFLWEREDEKPKREAEDFGRLAESIKQKADAELLSRQGQGILGSLYGAAEKGLNFLDEQRGAAQDAAQQFGQFAQDRLNDVESVRQTLPGSNLGEGIRNVLGVPEMEQAEEARTQTFRDRQAGGMDTRQAMSESLNDMANISTPEASNYQMEAGKFTVANAVTPIAKRAAQEAVERGGGAVRKALDLMGIGKQADEDVRPQRLPWEKQEYERSPELQALSDRANEPAPPQRLPFEKPEYVHSSELRALEDESRAPFSNPSRGAGDMLEAPNITPQDDSPVTKALRGMGIEGPRANVAESDRYYHGTGSDFARPDPNSFDSNGLFGPAYYVTDAPRVAGSGDVFRQGYAEQRGHPLQTPDVWKQAGIERDRELLPKLERDVEQGQQRIERLQRMYDDEPVSKHDPHIYKPPSPELLAEQSDRAARLESLRTSIQDRESALYPQSGPNIRPVDVPRDLKLLDADAQITQREAQQLLPHLDAVGADIAESVADTARRGTPSFNGQEIYASLRKALADAGDLPNGAWSPGAANAEVNRVLQDAGYDGIRYAGGKRIPMQDEAGKAIEHNAIAIFPESLDKITNATAGTKGGLLPGADDVLASVARGALTGGGYGAVSGGIEGSKEEGATPGSIAKRTLEGALMGAGNGGLRGVLPGSSAQAMIKNVVRTYGPADKKIEDAITPPAAPAGKTPGEWSDEMVRQLFDNAVPLRKVSEAAEKVRGSALSFGENAYNLLRLARGSGAAADQALEDHLGPVLKGASDQAVGDLNRYLKAMDIIDKDAVSPMHNFGGANVNDARQAIQGMGQALGQKGMQELDAKAQQVWNFGHELLQRKVDAGLISQNLYTELTTKFPHYSPIRIIDWIDDQLARGASGMGTVNKLSVNSTGLKGLTEMGTERAAETPLDAYVRLAHETYRRSMVNESAAAMVNHLKDLSTDPAWAKLITPADSDAAKLIGGKVAPRAPGQVSFHAFVNGDKFDFWLDKNLEQSINYVAPAMNQNLFTSLALEIPAKILRAGATSANALFMIPNAVGDAMTYMIRAGGVAGLPESLPALAKGWKSSLTKDSAYSDLRMAGGGYSGFFGAEANEGTKTINNLRGLNESLRAVIGVIPRAGERVESATRLAEYHRMLSKGSTKQEAALAARDVTIDFARGGEFAKWANAFVPFFNARMQAPAQVMRVMQNPATRARAMTGVMTSVVIPTIGLEIYNQQDPTYADVPQFDKDRGLIMMSPWGPGPVNPETGRKTPNYFVLGLREWAPFAIGVREAMAATVGKNRDGLEIAKTMFNQMSPIGGGAAGVLPPLLKEGVEQQTNYDSFRDRQIVPDNLTHLPNDQQYTSDTSEVAKLAGRLTGQSPMRIQHAVTGLTAGVGRQAIEAGDAALSLAGVTPAPGRRVQELQRELAKSGLSDEKRGVLQRELDVEGAKKQQRESGVRNIPVLGGFAGTVFREQGGEIDRRSTKDIDAHLQQLRSKDDPTGKELTRLGLSFPDADNEINGQSLNRYQSTEYRQKALAYREQMAQALMQSSAYKQADDQEKARLLRNGMTRAAAWASQEVLPGANTAGREFTTVANKNTSTAIDGYLKAIDAQQKIDDLKETRYLGYSGDDADQIAMDRNFLSRFRDQFGKAQGDTVFMSKYGVMRYAKAKAAKVNPMYRMKVEQIERQTPELFSYIRQNSTTTDLPLSA